MYTRGTGNEASPTLRAGSTSSDPNTTNFTIGNLTVGTITTAGKNAGVNDDDDEHSVDTEDRRKVNNSPSMSTKTTERDIVKSPTTALRAASKRRRCSSSSNLESKVEEYYVREESLNEKIATLTEENLRTQRNNLVLYRLI